MPDTRTVGGAGDTGAVGAVGTAGRSADVRTETLHTTNSAGIYSQPDSGSTQTLGAAAPVAYKRTSWGAIFAGTLTALATQLLLSMLGIAIGASTIDPVNESNPAAGLGIGAAIWFGISTLLSLFAGGWVAGRLAGQPIKTDSMLHGLLTWGLTSLLTFYLLTSVIGGLIGGTFRAVGSTLNTASQTAAAAGTAASNQPGIVRDAQEQVGNLADQAARLRDQAQANAPEIRNRAEQAGQAAASGTSKAALATFFTLLLGALAAAFGGRAATPRDLTAPGMTRSS